MFLKELVLKNFKCHDSLSLRFDTEDASNPIRKTTFILGENGTGKSAVLKAIALLTSGSSGLSDLLGKPDEWIRNGKTFCEIAGIITTQGGQERSISLRINRGETVGKIMQTNQASLEKIDAALAKADRNYFVVGYGASRRLSRNVDSFFSENERRSSQRSRNIQTLFFPDAPLVSLANWAMNLEYSRGNTGLTIVKKALNEFLVDNVVFKGIDKRKKTLVFDTPDGSVPLEQLSDGYQNVTAWVGDLMFNITNTFGDYKEPLKARGLLLIDEIDLHLHPRWQRQLHRFLQEKLPNFQVIATTHSPLTAQQAGENELYALKRENKKIVLIPFEGSPQKMLLHQLLTSPIFGVPTDESLEVQEAKEIVKDARLNKTKLSTAANTKIKKSKELLSTLPVNVRANSLLSSSDLELLQSINTKIKAAKK